MQSFGAEPPEPGATGTVGPYRLLEKLGRGGMGVVFRAEHVETGEHVALKTVSLSDPGLLSSIRREIHALRRVEHPGIVRIVDEGVEGGVPWYAMELLDGHTLRDYNLECWKDQLATNASSTSQLTPIARAETRLSPRPGSPLTRTGQEEPKGFMTEPLPPGWAAGTGPRSESSPLGRSTPAGAADSAEAVDSGPGMLSWGERPISVRPRPFQRAANGALEPTLRVFRAICRPLAFIHGLGLVHRDLKPENVFIRQEGEPVLFDFGLAVQFETRGRDGLELHFGNRPMGSPSYMAPEQIRGDLVDARADLYALGCMLYEAVTGDVPFVAAQSSVVLSMHLYASSVLASELVEGVPPELDALLYRLLQKRSGDRIGYAEDVAAALDALIPGDSTAGEVAAAPAPRARGYLYRPGIAGRGDALRELYSLLKRLQDGKGGLALVGGESGIGKTRLAMEIATEAARLQNQVIMGECVAVSAEETSERGGVKAAPLHPFRQFLLAVADRCRALGPQGYDGLLGPRGKVLAPYEPSLAELPGHERYAEPPELPADAARFRLESALAETLDAFVAHTQMPLLLVLDDLQWVDESSLGVLSHLGADYFEARRLLILGTYRTEEATGALLALAQPPWVTRIALRRLDARAVGRMVSDMLAMDRPPDAFIRFLMEQSEGNPFFIAEYLHTALEEGLLRRDGVGAWQLRAAPRREGPASRPPGGAPSSRRGGRPMDPARSSVPAPPASQAPPAFEDGGISALPLPRSLRELVVRRLSGLSPPARALSRMAAVLGREIEERVLITAAAMDELDAMDGLAELDARHVLEETGIGRLRFVHDKLREILYLDVPEAERRSLHAAAAQALEARFAGSLDLALSYPILAHHFMKAEARDKTLEYLEKAGEQALFTGASGEAKDYFARAITLEEDDDGDGERRAPTQDGARRARWERRLGVACYNLGDLRGAERSCAAALALLSQRGSKGALVQQAASLWQLGRQVVHLAGFEIPIATKVEERERLTEAALAAEQLSETYLFQNDPTRAFMAALEATNAAAGLGPSPALARGYATLSVAFGYVPLPRLVTAYATRAERTASATGDRRAIGFVTFMRGLTALSEGRCDDATALIEKAERIADELQDRRRREECMALLGSAAFFAGRWPEALARHAELSALARRSNNTQGQIWARSGRAQCLILLGDGEEAEEILLEEVELIQESGDRAQQITHGQIALAHLLRGDRAAARREAERTLCLIRRGRPAAFHCLHGYVAACEVLLAEEEATTSPAERRALAQKARAACRELQRYARIFPLGRSDALRLSGVADWLDGQQARARRTWLEGIEVAARLKLLGEEGRCRYELGRRLGRGDPDGARQLRRAAEIFATLEIDFWRERVEQAT